MLVVNRVGRNPREKLESITTPRKKSLGMLDQFQIDFSICVLFIFWLQQEPEPEDIESTACWKIMKFLHLSGKSMTHPKPIMSDLAPPTAFFLIDEFRQRSNKQPSR